MIAARHARQMEWTAKRSCRRTFEQTTFVSELLVPLATEHVLGPTVVVAFFGEHVYNDIDWPKSINRYDCR